MWLVWPGKEGSTEDVVLLQQLQRLRRVAGAVAIQPQQRRFVLHFQRASPHLNSRNEHFLDPLQEDFLRDPAGARPTPREHVDDGLKVFRPELQGKDGGWDRVVAVRRNTNN